MKEPPPLFHVTWFLEIEECEWCEKHKNVIKRAMRRRDVSKAYRLLVGYKAQIPFVKEIRRTAKWYKDAYEKHDIPVCPET